MWGMSWAQKAGSKLGKCAGSNVKGQERDGKKKGMFEDPYTGKAVS